MNPESTEARDSEAFDYLKQFAFTHESDSINIQSMKKLFPKLKGKNYDEDYMTRVRYINPNNIYKGIKKFHSNVGSLNISGVSIPKPEVRKDFDMQRINNLNSSIKEIENHYRKLIRLSEKIIAKINE